MREGLYDRLACAFGAHSVSVRDNQVIGAAPLDPTQDTSTRDEMRPAFARAWEPADPGTAELSHDGFMCKGSITRASTVGVAPGPLREWEVESSRRKTGGEPNCKPNHRYPGQSRPAQNLKLMGNKSRSFQNMAPAV